MSGGATPNFQEQLFGCVSQAFSIPQTDNRTKYPITLAAFCHRSPELRRLVAYSTWWPFPHLCESHHDLMARDASISEYSLHLREEKQWSVCCPSGDILECPTTVGRGIIEWGHCLLTRGLLHVNVRMKECLNIVFAGMTCMCACVCMISGTADRRVLTPSVRSRAGENGSDIITLELSAALDPNS